MTTTSNEPRGLKVYSLASAAGRRILAHQKIDLAQLSAAVGVYEATVHVPVGVLIGVHKRYGVFYSSDPEWEPDHPDAFTNPIEVIPWVHIHEILGRVPEGSTADYLNTNGTLN